MRRFIDQIEVNEERLAIDIARAIESEPDSGSIYECELYENKCGCNTLVISPSAKWIIKVYVKE